ncbi:DUF2087 domain-containing protein [Carnobacterium gallinarum]|uniref:DUF2087 domain-containing protein n=1 Tax=Carnobacterium gallinarum TaxID=2749 RepID=UPI0005523957|nr:DUF2087 domain-containing protein [Carnobacterium gallinarum]
MDLGKRTFQEIKQGYFLAEEGYHCHYCEENFSINQVYSLNDKIYMAQQAIQQHIEIEHSGNFQQLVGNESKYNTLTEKQKQLLIEFESGESDAEIAKNLGVSHSTIRHQKFTFREKAKQAKFYLALYENTFTSIETTEDALISIHNEALMIDDRYVTTEKEQKDILEKNFSTFGPLTLVHWPKKEKKKIVIMKRIIEELKINYTYTEKELTKTLAKIYHDPVTLRRYLYDYGYLNRTPDGGAYWLTK